MAALALVSCASGHEGPPIPPRFVAPPAAPEVVHCCDPVGHRAGAAPFVLGGTCCCTPSAELVEACHRDGIATELDLLGLRALYTSRGIRTAEDHRDCNNLCRWGPHVTEGGHCLVPPTPGTPNYERIVSGRVRESVPAAPGKEKER